MGTVLLKGRWLASLIAMALIGITVGFCASAVAAIRGCTDGRIAFDSVRNGNRAIYVIDPSANGTGTPAPTQVTAGPDDAKPSWSPPDPRNQCDNSPPPSVRATMIAFQRTVNGKTNIYLVNTPTPQQPNGGQAVPFTNGGADTAPAWAPNPQIPGWGPPNMVYPPIAFERNLNGHRDIFIANYDGTGETNLTNSSGADYANPDWSPGGAGDSPRLAFDSNQGGRREVWVMDVGYDANTGRYVNLGMRQVTAGQPVSSDPSWFTFTPVIPGAQPVSPLIDHIAFAGPDQDGGNSQINVAESAIGRNPNSTEPFADPTSIDFYALTNDSTDDTAPAWSPTGDRVAYQKTGTDGKSDIYVLDPTANDQTGDVNLTQHVGDNKNPDWEAPTFLGVEAFPIRPRGRRSRKRQFQRNIVTTPTPTPTPTPTTTTTQLSPPPPKPKPVQPAFSARLVSLVARGRGRSRAILIRLQVSAVANVTAELRNGHRRLASHRWRVTAGPRLLRLQVPAHTRAGVYLVRVTALPASGPADSLSRPVRLGR